MKRMRSLAALAIVAFTLALSFAPHPSFAMSYNDDHCGMDRIPMKASDGC